MLAKEYAETKISNTSGNPYDLENNQLPQLPIATQMKLYKSMESCALSQLVLFAQFPRLLSSLKSLVELIENETQKYLRTQIYNDGSVYLKIISLIDSLEVIDHIEGSKQQRKAVSRKLKKNLSLWKVPRHLVIKVINEHINQENTADQFLLCDQVHTLEKLSKQYKSERNELITANLKLVFSVAGKFRFLGMPYNDLVQEGSIGLLKAIERFDPSKGFLFSTYAYTAISHHIHAAIEKQASVVRKPYDQLRDKAIADKTRAKLEQQLSRPPRSHEFRASLPDNISNKAPYVELNTHATANTEWYAQSPEPEEHELIGKNEQDLKTQELLYKRDLKNILGSLDLRKQTILRMRYGIGINRTYTLKEISEILFISSERVRQLSLQSEKELNTILESEPDTDLGNGN
jgi:RNA polymerase sigma factor (sigma-70 family)